MIKMWYITNVLDSVKWHIKLMHEWGKNLLKLLNMMN